MRQHRACRASPRRVLFCTADMKNTAAVPVIRASARYSSGGPDESTAPVLMVDANKLCRYTGVGSWQERNTWAMTLWPSKNRRAIVAHRSWLIITEDIFGNACEWSTVNKLMLVSQETLNKLMLVWQAQTNIYHSYHTRVPNHKNNWALILRLF